MPNDTTELSELRDQVKALQEQNADLLEGSGAKFTQGECILYHELKLELFR